MGFYAFWEPAQSFLLLCCSRSSTNPCCQIFADAWDSMDDHLCWSALSSFLKDDDGALWQPGSSARHQASLHKSLSAFQQTYWKTQNGRMPMVAILVFLNSYFSCDWLKEVDSLFLTGALFSSDLASVVACLLCTFSSTPAIVLERTFGASWARAFRWPLIATSSFPDSFVLHWCDWDCYVFHPVAAGNPKRLWPKLSTSSTLRLFAVNMIGKKRQDILRKSLPKDNLLVSSPEPSGFLPRLDQTFFWKCRQPTRNWAIRACLWLSPEHCWSWRMRRSWRRSVLLTSRAFMFLTFFGILYLSCEFRTRRPNIALILPGRPLPTSLWPVEDESTTTSMNSQVHFERCLCEVPSVTIWLSHCCELGAHNLQKGVHVHTTNTKSISPCPLSWEQSVPCRSSSALGCNSAVSVRCKCQEDVQGDAFFFRNTDDERQL